MQNITLPNTREVQYVLDSCTNLPSLPAVALKIIGASKDPDISIDQILAIITKDAVISAKMLKFANSPLYSQNRPINSLHDALMLLGCNAALTVALCFSLPTSLAKNVLFANYWKRSILSASISRVLAKRLAVPNIEDLFLTSLLQDIGILVIQSMDKPPYPLDENKALSHADFIQSEKDVLGIEHSFVGALLLQSWGLPDFIVYSVTYSHSLNLEKSLRSEASDNFHHCLSLAGDLADIWLNNDPDRLLNEIVAVTKNILDLDDDEFNQLIIEIDDLLPEISSMFEVSLIEEQDRRRVVESARDLLIERSLSTSKEHDDANRKMENISKKAERFEKENQLDSLTRIYNRQYFYQQLNTEFEQFRTSNKPFSLAFIDTDDFKLINDTYGHLVGDDILKLAAGFFTKNTRETDIIARFGGDEFLLMLGNSNAENSLMLLERLVENYHKEVSIDVNNIRLTMSISVGFVTYSGERYFHSVNGLLQAADEALYEAKRKGKNCVAAFQIPTK